MSTDKRPSSDDEPDALDAAKRAVAEAAGRAAADHLVDRVAERFGALADDALSALERSVFGDGQSLQTQAAAPLEEDDALNRARARYGLTADPLSAGSPPSGSGRETPPEPPSAEAVAREQLAALKRKLGKPA